MRLADLVAHYPVLYHMAAEGSWRSISRHGLLSTSALLDLFEIETVRRMALEVQHRPETVSIQHSRHGVAEIRDQKPMSDAGLRRALGDNLTPREWYVLLNSKVFFWTSERRLHRLLCARAYRKKAHDVLIVDTAPLIHAHSDRARLCAINSGATKPFAHPRRKDAFQPISSYPWDEWVKKRGIREAVVEVAFESGILDIARFTRRVVRMREAQILETVYEN